MSTITKEFTKEQLIKQAKKNIEVLRGAVEKIPGASDAAVIHLKLAEITLASLEAEPVISHLGSKNALDAIVAFIKSNRNPTLKDYNEVSERLFQDNCHGLSNHVIEYIKQIGEELEELRSTQDTAPPVPVSVPESAPVAYIFKHPAGRLFWSLTDESNKGQSDVMPVYTAPPAPVTINAEPVAWLWAHRKHQSEVSLVRPEDDERAEGAHWSGWSCQALYAAPPEPVSVPDEVLKRLLPDAEKAEFWFEHDGKILFEGVKFNNAVFEACRAAMLQGAEPVTTDYKLRDAVDIIRNSGIAIDAEKILAERDALNATDCWCRTCRPITLTDMRFVVCPDCGNKRCPHANDHLNACTGSNEPGQEGSAYPAAPQQEVK